MKLKSVGNKVNPFSSAHYTEEEKAVFKKRDGSKKRAEEFFKEMYDQPTAWAIVANVMVVYYNTYTDWAETLEQAQNVLGYDIISDIIYRAVNGSPAKKQKRRG